MTAHASASFVVCCLSDIFLLSAAMIHSGSTKKRVSISVLVVSFVASVFLGSFVASPYSFERVNRRDRNTTHEGKITVLENALEPTCRGEQFFRDHLKIVHGLNGNVNTAIAVYYLLLHCSERFRFDYLRKRMASHAFYFWRQQGVIPLFVLDKESCFGKKWPTFEDLFHLDVIGRLDMENNPDNFTTVRYWYTIPFAEDDESSSVYASDDYGSCGRLPISVRSEFDIDSEIRVEVWVRYDYVFPLDEAMRTATRYSESRQGLEFKPPLTPQWCEAQPEYVIGTRFYVYELFLLPEVRLFDVAFKLDYDLFFYNDFPFVIARDMFLRKALFAAAFTWRHGDASCAENLNECISSFNNAYKTEPCAKNKYLYELEADVYVGNFVAFYVPFFASTRMLVFSEFFANFPDGWSKHRWGDQAFYHKAIGQFVADFENYVVDYSQFKCYDGASNAWSTPFDVEKCKDAVFMHEKSDIPVDFWTSTLINRFITAEHSEPYALNPTDL